MRRIKQGIFIWALALGLAAGPALAEGLTASIAPSLLKARTQASILKTDDQADLNCTDKAFSDAEVTYQPWQENAEETKWLENWTLNRCGTQVTYRVFFTTVGDGGAYFSFEELN